MEEGCELTSFPDGRWGELYQEAPEEIREYMRAFRAIRDTPEGQRDKKEADKECLSKFVLVYGAGGLHLLNNIRVLSADPPAPPRVLKNGKPKAPSKTELKAESLRVTVDKIHCNLFDRWLYDSSGNDMHWDPDLNPPGGSGRQLNATCNPAVNLIATHGLVYYPHLETDTVGFKEIGKNLYFVWGMWREPIPSHVVRHVVAMPTRTAIYGLGDASPFYSERRSIGKTPYLSVPCDPFLTSGS
jgi:hypothetical protein